MALGVRSRLAIASGLVLFASLSVYAVVVRSVYVAGAREQHRRSEEAELRRETERLAARIIDGYASGAPMTIGETFDRAPIAAPALRNLVDERGSLVWVLDRRGFMIYNSLAVRALADFEQTGLDSLAAVYPAAATTSAIMAGRDSGVIRISGQTGRDVERLPFRDREILLYSLNIEWRVAGVSRIVVGRLSTPPPAEPPSFAIPFFLLLPLLLIAAAGSAALYARIALAPAEERIGGLIGEVTAITDGRSLHRRLPTDEAAGPQLVRLAETLNAMLGRLETSFAALRRFTADASHELKTPLTVLRADVERAMAEPHRREQLVYLEEALAEITRMADLVDSLLTLARADEGRFELHREPVALDALAREVMETAVLLGEGAKITVRMDPPPPITVQGDRGRLRQLFLNLVTNAIKYTPSGGHVELSLVGDATTARFSVSDTGIGIAAADIPHVFERFWRADPSRSRGGERVGVGLGLAISHYISQAHGGSLTVQSRLGRGSIFTVQLPISAPPGASRGGAGDIED